MDTATGASKPWVTTSATPGTGVQGPVAVSACSKRQVAPGGPATCIATESPPGTWSDNRGEDSTTTTKTAMALVTPSLTETVT